MAVKEHIEKILEAHPDLCPTDKKAVSRTLTEMSDAHGEPVADFEVELVEGYAAEEEQEHKTV